MSEERTNTNTDEKQHGDGTQVPGARRSSAGGDYVMAHTDIPAEVVSRAEKRLRLNAGVEHGEKHDVAVHPAKSGASYKGRVLAVDDRFIVQEVGREAKTAIVHRRDDLDLVSNNMKWRAENQRLGGIDVQIHYAEGKGKVYPWDREKEQSHKLTNAAQQYAKEHLKNPKQREAFLKHLGALNEQVFGAGRADRKPAEREAAPKSSRQTPPHADHGVER